MHYELTIIFLAPWAIMVSALALSVLLGAMFNLYEYRKERNHERMGR